MKIYAISDLHISANGEKPMEIFGGNWVGYLDRIKEDWNGKVNDDDVVLIAGDISWAMKAEEVSPDLAFFDGLKGKKVVIKGNHDYWWTGIGKVRGLMPENCFALQNDSIKFGKVVICGSRGWAVPDSPDFKESDRKIYLREAERFRLSLASAKKSVEDGDKLIVMIHYPPFTSKKEDTLFTELFEEYKADAVVFGHLHGKFVRYDKITVKNGVKYYLTSCDQTDNKLTEIEL
ncbi:MAG: metallophosphoesterase [Clostridia bacterium]|nr:metallophosphoesterase [Clostridia bacterium]